MPLDSEVRKSGARIVAEAEPRVGPGVFANSIVNVVGLIGINAIGAVAGIITALTLGPAAVGVLAVAFGIGEFGRALTACTHIPSIQQYHAGKDAGVVFGSSFAVKALLSGIFLAIVILSAGFVEATFGIPPLVMLVATSVLVASSFFEVGAARLEAVNMMVRSNLILASGSVTMLLGIGLLALVGALSIFTSPVSTLAANLVMSVFAFVYARPRDVVITIDWALAWSMTKAGMRIVSASMLSQGLLWTDTLLVSYLLGNAQAGIYATVFALTYAMVMASSAMGVALVPALSRLAAEGRETAAGYHRGTVLALSMSGGLALVYLLFGKVILGFYGPGFSAGYPALAILTLFGLSAALTVPAATMLTIHGRAGLLTLLSLGQLIVNVPLNLLLIGKWGIIGASIATTSVFALGTTLSWIAVRRTVGAWPLSFAALREARDFALARIEKLRP